MHYTLRTSAIFEKISHYKFPKFIQKKINKNFVKMFHINLDEFSAIENYHTLNELFTRPLLKPRKIDNSANVIIAPCDSRIMALGKLSNNKALQIKGREYFVGDFLWGDNRDTIWSLDDYYYVNFYLSPTDYHRFHAPCNMSVLSICQIAGILKPVNLKSLKKNSNLFIKNKRVILECKDDFGNLFYFIAIGALNVGKIQIKDITLSKEQYNTSWKFCFNEARVFKKGEEIGYFEMGSTIVLFTQKWDYDLLKEGQKVCFGDTIGHYSISG